MEAVTSEWRRPTAPTTPSPSASHHADLHYREHMLQQQHVKVRRHLRAEEGGLAERLRDGAAAGADASSLAAARREQPVGAVETIAGDDALGFHDKCGSELGRAEGAFRDAAGHTHGRGLFGARFDGLRAVVAVAAGVLLLVEGGGATAAPAAPPLWVTSDGGDASGDAVAPGRLRRLDRAAGTVATLAGVTPPLPPGKKDAFAAAGLCPGGGARLFGPQQVALDTRRFRTRVQFVRCHCSVDSRRKRCVMALQVAFDARHARVIVCDEERHCVLAMRVADGRTTLLAGIPGTPGSNDGTADVATFLCVHVRLSELSRSLSPPPAPTRRRRRRGDGFQTRRRVCSSSGDAPSVLSVLSLFSLCSLSFLTRSRAPPLPSSLTRRPRFAHPLPPRAASHAASSSSRTGRSSSLSSEATG